MRARDHGGAEMAKVGCRVDARADRGACENEKRGEGKGDGERRTLCPGGVYASRVWAACAWQKRAHVTHTANIHIWLIKHCLIWEIVRLYLGPFEQFMTCI